MRTTALLFASLLIASPALSQKAAESIEVTLVEVPVFVIDRNGEPIRNLTAANFELFDQGQKRTISHFDVIDFSTRRSEQSTATLPASARRNFLLLFDLAHTAPANLGRAREAAISFVNRQAGRGDRVAVGTISERQGFRLLSSFTTDRTLSTIAIQTLGSPKYYQPKDPLLLAASEFEQMAADAGGREGGAIADELREMSDQQKRLRNQEQSQMISRELGQYTGLGRLLDRVRGRKDILLLSEGFDAKMLHGREQLNTEEARREQTSLEYGEIWKVDTDARYGNSTLLSGLKDMVDALRRSDVVLNAIDVKGLRNDVDAAEGLRDEKKSNESLFLMSGPTGGRVFQNSNDLNQNFTNFLKGQEVTYILGFETSTTTPGKFHDIKVRLTGVNVARVSHRPGYYEPSAGLAGIDRTLTAGEIIVNNLAANDINVQALAVPFPLAEGRFAVPVILEIDGKSLLEGAKENTLNTEVFIYAFDKNELIQDFAIERVGFDLAKLRSRLLAKGVKFFDTLKLKPGDYSIRTLVRTSNGRNGFRSTNVHVPAPNEASVTAPIVIDEDQSWLLVKPTDRVPMSYPFVAGADSFIPATGSFLSRDKMVKVALIAYNLPDENFRVTASGIDAAGASHPIEMAVSGEKNANRRTFVVQFKPAQLAAGRYSLVFNVANKSVELPAEIR